MTTTRAEALAELIADRDKGARDYCALMDRHDALMVEVQSLRASIRHALTELGQSAQDMPAMRAERALVRALPQQEGAKG